MGSKSLNGKELDSDSDFDIKLYFHWNLVGMQRKVSKHTCTHTSSDVFSGNKNCDAHKTEAENETATILQ